MLSLEYPSTALRALARVVDTQSTVIEEAARLLADVIGSGGVVQAFGTGHSRAVTLELCSRAGGLAPMSMLAVKDLVMFGGWDPAAIVDPRTEREPGLAEKIYELGGVERGDAFVIVSNSGINSAIVQMAEIAHDRGHPVVAITSLAHTSTVSSRDASGRNLRDIADLVIDNGAPLGDAAIQLAEGVRVGGLSNLTGIFIVQVLVEAIARLLEERGKAVPAFVSANLPDGDERNRLLLEKYAARVRPIEP
jgi:uncharacterized phosphosugar-binding protein